MYEAEKGMNFYQAVKTLQEILREKRSKYRIMVFNDINVTVSIDSNIDDLSIIYDLKRQLAKCNTTKN